MIEYRLRDVKEEQDYNSNATVESKIVKILAFGTSSPN